MNLSIVRTALGRSHRVLAAVEQKWPYLLALLSLLFLAFNLFLDSKRPLWNDELFTFYISRQPTLHHVWNALLTGAEQLPLFFFVVIRLFTAIFGTDQTALRLPETLGFLLMTVSLFLFLRKRVPASYALVGFIFPAVTDAYYYACEARPYGLVMGFCGLAMLSWQSAADGRKRPLSLVGIALFLACAVNSHYYAVLLLVPFGFAELVRYFERRRFDWAMYIAIISSVLPLILSFPVIRAASKYASHFWAKPNWTSLISFYETLLGPSALTLMLLALISGLAVYWRGPDTGEKQPAAGITTHEFGLAFGFLLIPATAIFLAKFVTGAFTPRYSIYAVIGLSMLLAWTLATIGRHARGLGFILAAAAVGCWLVLAVRNYQQFVGNQVNEDKTFEFLTAIPTDLPLVLVSPHQFFVQSHVAARKGRGHFIYLADVPLALKYTETDTVERGLITLRNYAPLDVEDYRSFAASHPQFLLYGFPSDYSWLMQALIDAGRPVSVKMRDGGDVLYLVEAPSTSTTSAGSAR